MIGAAAAEQLEVSVVALKEKGLLPVFELKMKNIRSLAVARKMAWPKRAS